MFRGVYFFTLLGLVFGVQASDRPVEVLDWHGFEVHVFEVERCGTNRELLSNPDGYLCFNADPPEYDGDSIEKGCLLRQIWPSGRGTVSRIGFWSGYDGWKNSDFIVMYGERESPIGPRYFWKDDGSLVIETDDGEAPAEPLISCRVGGKQ